MASEGAETVVVTKPKVKKLKPARKQVKAGEVVKTETPQTGKEYNIWYNKWAGGDREDNYSNKVKSQTRCNIKRDSGLTRANTTGMKYTCLFFARGCCPYGWDSKDCFARDKFADYRDDMGGVGSFNRQNRTLYVGRIKETGTGLETEEVVRRHFKEFGEIERDDSPTTHAVKVLQYRSVAFVTYKYEIHAQFAKEAMACQSLDNDEILNVRWATEDPNPVSKVAEKRRLEEMGQEAIKARMDPRIVDAMRAVRALEDGDILDDDGELTQEQADEGDDTEGRPDTKRRKIEQEKEEEATSPPPREPTQPTSLLSADTLEGLKYFAQIRQQNGAMPVKPQVRPPTAPTGLSLADYGSDNDDD
ncbi:Pre-mRNA-splicing factor CWC2 [Termitomyces sp. J132]|nr:Pre-mRNA-splicing factor CWC2 [Termitomyces sp. J132]